MTQNGEDPDWVWTLKCLERPKDGENGAYEVRIFDENSAASKRISVRDYTSLDNAPELIFFEGRYSKKTQDAKLMKRSRPGH